MRILHVFDHSLPLQSGYVTRSLGIINAQRSLGWQTIHMTTPRHVGATSTVEVVDGLTFCRTTAPVVSAPVLRELAEMRATRRRMTEIVASEKPDVIHAHSPVLNATPALSVGRQFGLPVVYEVRALWEDAAVDHGTTREGSLRYRATRMVDTWAMRRVAYVIPICEPLRQDIVARGIPADRVAVVPNAVSRSLLSDVVAMPGANELRAKLGLGASFVLGFIGSFYAYEGLDLLLRAARRLRERNVDFALLLVGGGPEETNLRKMAADLELSNVVHFTGRVHHSEVPRYYDLVDLLVFPRKRMRLTDLVTPLKPLEAMAQSKPVLASDVGGHRELIRDGETGFLFPAGDVPALASRLEQIIRAPGDLAAITRAGRHFIETERTWEVVAGRYKDIYERIASR